MQKNIKFLNSKEVKKIKKSLLEQYGTDQLPDVVFLLNAKNKLYIINREVEELPLDDLRVDSLGMYFGELYDEQVRLSMDACQLVGPTATKNIIELPDDKLEEWVKGEAIELPKDIWKDIENGKFVLVKHNDDYLGCGKRNNLKLLNYVSKIRKLRTLNA